MTVDLLSNMFVSINRGIVKNQFKIYCKKSKYLYSILLILFKEGLINGFRTDPLNKNNVEIILKYFYGKSVIKKIIRVSKNSRPIYLKRYKLINKLLYENYFIDGFLIISTTKGLMSHQEAIIKNLGGQVICKII